MPPKRETTRRNGKTVKETTVIRAELVPVTDEVKPTRPAFGAVSVRRCQRHGKPCQTTQRQTTQH